MYFFSTVNMIHQKEVVQWWHGEASGGPTGFAGVRGEDIYHDISGRIQTLVNDVAISYAPFENPSQVWNSLVSEKTTCILLYLRWSLYVG